MHNGLEGVEGKKNVHDENKFKASTMTFGHCDKTIQHTIEECINFELEIRNDPFLLLEMIELKTCGQGRAKHEFVQPADTMMQFLSLKQDHGESLMDHTK